jgi:3-O-alpha-D-mannopyranosyl-alpha-D-mannopyranose xylosylphosphotransferase
MAFERAHCGDCLIHALITASGERGLSAFLPDEEIRYQPTKPADERWKDTGPILPLTSEWRETNFSMAEIITSQQPGEAGRSVNLREWCLSLLSRYVYTIGGTPAVFAPVSSTRQLSYRLAEVDTKTDTALVCINDDIPDKSDRASGQFKHMLGRWMDNRWPIPGPWERRGE